MGRRLDSFLNKVQLEPNSGCWIWVGARSRHGYGSLRDGKRIIAAHRWIYEELVGSIDPDKEINHKCGLKPCVNPQHLEQITHTENIRLAVKPAKSHCKRGHLRTYRRPDDNSLDCRICRNEAARRHSAQH